MVTVVSKNQFNISENKNKCDMARLTEELSHLFTLDIKNLWTTKELFMNGFLLYEVLTFVLLDTAKVARLEKRVMEGLLPDTGLVTMEETLEPAGGLLEVEEDEKVAGGDAGIVWLLRLL